MFVNTVAQSDCNYGLSDNGEMTNTLFYERNGTMSNSKQAIIDELKYYIQKGGGDYSAWYVGICNDAENMLFGHKVGGYWWMYKRACSSKSAREIRDYFINTLCTDGDARRGDDSADIVYVYKKEARTVR